MGGEERKIIKDSADGSGLWYVYFTEKLCVKILSVSSLQLSSNHCHNWSQKTVGSLTVFVFVGAQNVGLLIVFCWCLSGSN